MRFRFEPFGAIISLKEPPYLVYVDRNFMKERGFYGGEIWGEESKYLTAPVEVHLDLTKKCNFNCSYCYSSSKIDGEELPFELGKKIIDKLRDIGAFRIAFGGGEPLTYQYIFELAEYADNLEVLPSLTTNGSLINDENINRFKVFQRVNISLDINSENLGRDGDINSLLPKFKKLNKIGVRSGANFVVTKLNYENLSEFVKIVKDNGGDSILILRLKPYGRGIKNYNELKLTKKQNVELIPLCINLSLKYEIPIEIDCSFLPHTLYHKPDKKNLENLACLGCSAGDYLISIDEKGFVHPCSFLPQKISYFENIDKVWNSDDTFIKLRNFEKEPCISCYGLSLCKGGCHLISYFYYKDYFLPDPECPIVSETI